MIAYTPEHLSAALTWIEHHIPDGIQIVAQALSESDPEGPAEVDPMIVVSLLARFPRFTSARRSEVARTVQELGGTVT